MTPTVPADRRERVFRHPLALVADGQRRLLAELAGRLLLVAVAAGISWRLSQAIATLEGLASRFGPSLARPLEVALASLAIIVAVAAAVHVVRWARLRRDVAQALRVSGSGIALGEVATVPWDDVRVSARGRGWALRSTLALPSRRLPITEWVEEGADLTGCFVSSYVPRTERARWRRPDRPPLLAWIEQLRPSCVRAIWLPPAALIAPWALLLLLTLVAGLVLLLSSPGRDPRALAVRLLPQVAATHCVHARALAELGRFEEALAAYDRALVIDPELAWIHGQRAVLLDAREDWAGSLQARLLAGARSTDALPAWRAELSQRLLLLGRTDAARRQCGMARQANPDSRQARIALAQLELAAGEPEAALALLMVPSLSDSDTARVPRLLARRCLGHVQDADAELATALALPPDRRAPIDLALVRLGLARGSEPDPAPDLAPLPSGTAHVSAALAELIAARCPAAAD